MNKYIENVSLKEHANWLVKELDKYPGNDAFDPTCTKRLLQMLKDFSGSLDAEIASTRADYDKQVESIALETLKESEKVVTPHNGKHTGMQEVEFYASYDDSISRKAINELLDEDSPVDGFVDMVECSYRDEYDRTCESLQDEIKDAVLVKLGGIDDIDDIVRDTIEQNVVFLYPFEHYLKQEVHVPIMMDTGDSGADYTLNCLMDPDGEHPTPWIHEHSSALWLAKQQGYTESQLVDAMQTDDLNEIEDEFLRGLCQEMDEVSGRVGQLVFLTKLTLKELLALNTAMKAGEGSITITDPFCGLFDKVNGAGGMDLHVDKPIEIPVKLIQSAKADVPHPCHPICNYGIQETFEFIGAVWKDTEHLNAKFDFPKAVMDQFSVFDEG